MYDRIYTITSPAWQPDPELPDYLPVPPQSAHIAVNGIDEAYLVGEAGFADWDAMTSVLVGSWDGATGLQEGQEYTYDAEGVITGVTGTPTYPVTQDYALWIRPLGNDEGRATGVLDSTRWQGHSEEKFLEDDKRYLQTNTPFMLKITRVEHVAPDPWPGWGWVVEMISDDPLRDITARAVGIYSDPECTSYLYTTGAFIQDGSHDNNYYTECPVGQRQPTNEQVNFALLLGAGQEGFFNLLEGGEDLDALFWAGDAPTEENLVTHQSQAVYHDDVPVTY